MKRLRLIGIAILAGLAIQCSGTDGRIEAVGNDKPEHRDLDARNGVDAKNPGNETSQRVNESPSTAPGTKPSGESIRRDTDGETNSPTSNKSTTDRKQALTGGPDDFGYKFRDSNEPYGPDYNFLTVQDNRSRDDCDDCTERVPIPVPAFQPFIFEFYGTGYDSVYINTNGVLVLQPYGSEPGDFSSTRPVAENFSTIIAPWWDDWNPHCGNTDRIYYGTTDPESLPGRVFVVTWKSVSPYDHCDAPPVTFQVQLHEHHNRIEFHYKNTESGRGHTDGALGTVGIDRGLEQHLSYSHDESSLSGNFAIEFYAENDPPSAGDDANVTVPEETAKAIDVLGNDDDPDRDKLAVSKITSTPSHGSVSINSDPAGGDTVTYTPSDPEFSGSDSFEYKIKDWHGGTDKANVSINVTSVNDPPEPIRESVTTDEDEPFTVDLDGQAWENKWVKHPDSEGEVSLKSAESGAHGTVTVENGELKWDPEPNFNKNFDDAPPTFDYTLEDAHGHTRTGTVEVFINPKPDPPIAVDDSATTPEEQSVTVHVLADDWDPDEGETASLTITDASVDRGEVFYPAVQGAIKGGRIRWSPPENFDGEATVDYRIEDRDGKTGSGKLTIDVTPKNDRPTAKFEFSPDSPEVNDTIDLVSNSTDIEDSSLDTDWTLTKVPPQSSGSVSGSIFVADKPGNYRVELTVTDSGGLTDSTSRSFEATNDPPIAKDDTIPVDEGGALQTTGDNTVVANDVDPNGDDPTVISHTKPAYGTVDVDSAGHIDFQYTGNDPNFTGTDTFFYTIDDGHGETSTATVQLDFQPVNDAPVAEDASLSTDEDTQLVALRLISDVDDPDSALQITETKGATHGSATVTDNERGIVYTPDSDYAGKDSFTFTVRDDDGATDGGRIDVTVDPVDDPPIATRDRATTTEDTPVLVDVLGNTYNGVDRDVDDGDTVSLKSADGGEHGEAKIVEGEVEWTPDDDYNKANDADSPAVFSYTIADRDGDTASAEVEVAVDPINDVPDANVEMAPADPKVKDAVTLTSRSSDVDSTIQSVDWQFVDRPARSNAALTAGLPCPPTVVTAITPCQEAARFTADVPGDYAVKLTVTDSQGNSGTHEQTIAVTNDAPTAGGDSYTTKEDQTLTVRAPGVLGNDGDPNGDETSVMVDSSVGEDLSIGSVELNADGSFEFSPNADSHGTDTFSYTVEDEFGKTAQASVDLTVEPVNDEPTAGDDDVATDEDTPVTIDVLSNDGDIETDIRDFTIGSGPTDGTIEVNNNPSGPDTIQFDPDLNFNGTDSFDYKIADGDGGTDRASVDVTVDPVNDEPAAGDDDVATDEDAPVTVDVLANDSDIETDITDLTIVSGPANGTIEVNDNPSGADTVEFDPDLNFNGTDSFDYKIDDGDGGTDRASVDVTVDPVNDAPTAGDGDIETDEDAEVTTELVDLELTGDVDDPKNALKITEATGAENGTTSPTPEGKGVTYEPSSNFNGPDRFEYTLRDGAGATSTGRIDVMVHPVNDAPTASENTAQTPEDTAVTIDVVGDDTDVDESDPLYVSGVTQPENGEAEIVDPQPATASAGTGPVPSNPNGQAIEVRYTPDADYEGPTDSFQYTVSDQAGAVDTASVTVSITPVNDAPRAELDISDSSPDVGQTITLDGSQSADPKDSGSGIASHDWTITGPGGAKIQKSGETVDHAIAQDGKYDFELTVTDDGGKTDTARIENVDSNALPEAAFEVAPQQPLVGETVDLDASVSSDGDHPFSSLSLEWRLLEAPNGSNAQFESTNTVSTSLTPSTSGEYRIELMVEDPNGATDTATETFRTNRAPKVELAKTSFDIDANETIALDANGSSDPDGTIRGFEWNVVDSPSGIDPSGILASPNSAVTDFVPQGAGHYELEVAATDSQGARATGTATVDVNALPTATVSASKDVVDLGRAVELDATNSLDPDGGNSNLDFDWRLAAAPTGSNVGLGSKTGPAISFAPDASGRFAVEVIVTDADGATDRAQIGLTGNASPRPAIQSSADVVEVGDPVKLSASQSTDDHSDLPDMEFRWEVSSAPQGGDGALTSQSGPSTQLIPPTSGEYALELKAVDEHGAEASASKTLIGNASPTASLESIPDIVSVGEEVELNGSGTDPDGSSSGLTGHWRLTDKPADSGVDLSGRAGMSGAFTPDVSGRFQIEFTVTDEQGSTASATASTKANAVPVAEIARDEIRANASESIQLDATASRDPNHHRSELNFNWNASSKPDGANAPELTGPAPTFSLSTPGTYKIDLAVTDPHGAEAVDTTKIEVNAPPMFVDPTPDSVRMLVGQKIEFPVNAKNPDGSAPSIELVDGPENAVLEDNTVTWDAKVTHRDPPTFLLRASDGQATVKHPVGVVFETEVASGSSDLTSCSPDKCGEGETCHSGRCFQSCDGAEDCSDPDKVCLADTRCAADPCERIDCKEGERCRGGTCFANCQGDDQCGDGEQCIEGRCAEGPCAGIQCPEGQQCREGVCIDGDEQMDVEPTEDAQTSEDTGGETEKTTNTPGGTSGDQPPGGCGCSTRSADSGPGTFVVFGVLVLIGVRIRRRL